MVEVVGRGAAAVVAPVDEALRARAVRVMRVRLRARARARVRARVRVAHPNPSRSADPNIKKELRALK